MQKPLLRATHSGVLTLSAAEARMLEERGYVAAGAAPIEVVRLGLDAVPLIPTDARRSLAGPAGAAGGGARLGVEQIVREGPYLLHVGRLTQRKNIPRLIAAWEASTLIRSHRLIFVGPSEDPSVEAAISSATRASYVGQVSEAELDHLYQSSDFVVVCSLAEGFGLPVGEALNPRSPWLQPTWRASVRSPALRHRRVPGSIRRQLNPSVARSMRCRGVHLHPPPKLQACGLTTAGGMQL